MQFAADGFDHRLVFGRIGVGVCLQVLLVSFAFQCRDLAAGDQFQFGRGAREVQIRAAEQQGRAGKANVQFLGAAAVQKVRRSAQLGAAHQRIVDKHQPLVADHFIQRDQLHVRDEVASALVLRHKRARPRVRVFDERPGQGQLGSVGIADGVRRSRIGQSRHGVGGDVVPHGERRTAAIAHVFDVQPLVDGGRVSVIYPEEGADVRLAAGRADDVDAFRRHKIDLAGAEFPVKFVSEIEESKRFERYAEGSRFFADDDGGLSVFVARNVDPFGSEDEDGHRAVDGVLCDLDALGDACPAVDEGGDQLGGVDVAAAHFEEVRRALRKCFFDQLFEIVDAPDGRDGKVAEVRTHQQRLRLAVRNAPDADVSLHLVKIAFEFGAEGGIFDVMDGAVEPAFPVDRHAPAPCAEVRMVIRSEKEIENAVLFRNNSEKAAQNVNLRK